MRLAALHCLLLCEQHLSNKLTQETLFVRALCLRHIVRAVGLWLYTPSVRCLFYMNLFYGEGISSDIDGMNIGEYGKGGEPARFQSPVGIAAATNRLILVVERNKHQISMLKLESHGKSFTCVNSFGSRGCGNGEFMYPSSIAVTKQFALVTDSMNNRVAVLQLDTQQSILRHLTSFDGRNSATGKLHFPCGISVDRQETLVFVTDLGNSRIVVLRLSPDGCLEPLTSFYGDATRGMQLQSPWGIAVTEAHTVLVSDSCGKLILLRLDQDKNQAWLTQTNSFDLTKSGSLLGVPKRTQNIASITIAAGGSVLVADRSNHQILVLRLADSEEKLTYTSSYGQFGKGDAQLRFPSAMAQTTCGTVFVSDTGNNRIILASTKAIASSNC